MEENVKRVDNRANDYIKDSNQNNIHDIRTAIRRFNAHLNHYQTSCKKKMICKYITTSKRLFKINSQIRDYDIICEKLEKNIPQSQFILSYRLIEQKKKNKTCQCKKNSIVIKRPPLPHISDNDLQSKKLEMRYNRVVCRLREKIRTGSSNGPHKCQ